MKLLLAAFLALLASCATPLQPDASVSIAGDWEIVAVNGQPTGGGEQFILSLNPPRGWAQFGCNIGGGAARLERGWLLAGDWIVTAASCVSKERARFERQGFDILGSPAAIERRSGGVRLRNERGSIDLRPLEPMSLADTRWTVVDVSGRPPPSGWTIHFGKRELEGYFGWKRFSGTYHQDAGLLRPSINSIAQSGRAPEVTASMPVAAYKKGAISILSQDARIERVRPGAVRLTNERGSILLERARS